MKNIFIIDDNPDFLETIARFLEQKGHRAVTAASGEEAIERMKGSKPDLVLIDLLMPRMGGFEVYDLLKKNGLHAPVFMISGANDPHAINKSFLLGIDGFIIKARSLDTLYAKIASCL